MVAFTQVARQHETTLASSWVTVTYGATPCFRLVGVEAQRYLYSQVLHITPIQG